MYRLLVASVRETAIGNIISFARACYRHHIPDIFTKATAVVLLLSPGLDWTNDETMPYHRQQLQELLRDLGVDQASLFAAEPPLGFAVARIEVDFRRPARMDDLLDVETRVADLGGASLTMHQRLTRGGDLLVEATVRVAAVSRGRAARLPRDLAALLRG